MDVEKPPTPPPVSDNIRELFQNGPVAESTVSDLKRNLSPFPIQTGATVDENGGMTCHVTKGMRLVDHIAIEFTKALFANPAIVTAKVPSLQVMDSAIALAEAMAKKLGDI